MVKKIAILLVAFQGLTMASPTTYGIERPDKTWCQYHVERDHIKKDPFSLVLALNGSDTASVTWFMPIVDIPWCKKMSCVVLGVEKPGVTKDSFNKSDYFKLNTLTQRADDCRMVIDHIRATEPQWDGKLIILGGSEGATLAAYLTPLTNPTATIMLSGGCGMTLRQELITLEKKLATSGIRGNLEKLYGIAKTHFLLSLSHILTCSTMTCVGDTNTLKWWHKIADYNPATSLEKVATPLYLAHGSADINCPVESAHALVEKFEKLGKSNLVFREYAGLDHSYNNAEGENYFGPVSDEALAWSEQFLGR